MRLNAQDFPYLDDMRNCLKEFHEFGVAVVSHAALAPEVVMVRRYEFTEGHATTRAVLKEVHYLTTEL